MLLIDLLEFLKRVVLVCVTHHCTVTTDGLPTGIAEVVQLCLGVDRAVLNILLLGHLFLVLDGLHDVCHEACVHELVGLQWCPAVGTLLSCVLDPLAEATAAGKFGTSGTHDSIVYGTHADKAHEELLKVDILSTLGIPLRRVLSVMTSPRPRAPG